MKKKEAIQLWNTLTALKRIKNTKFAYFVARNLGYLKSEIDALTEAQKPDEKGQEYEHKRREVITAHAEKNEAGNPVESSPGFLKIPDMAKLSEALKDLDSEYKEVVEALNKQRKEFETILEEEISLELYKIKYENLPEEIDGNEMEVIMPLIDSQP